MNQPPASPRGPVLVRKYGGSSLASVGRIAAVARDLRQQHEAGKQVVVVVSAMGRTTDELSALALQVSPAPPRREMDMLLSVGERITMSLLAMALEAEGCPAISYTGSQCGIITDGSHTDARIIEVRGDRVRKSLAAGRIVIVAGFQGVSRDREITTLGRGGSDATAVALAAALNAETCEILKDVPGVMSADPHLVPTAWTYEELSWEELRRIASSGCGVVHIRAVEYAAEHGVPLRVGSSFEEGPGTRVGSDSVSSEGTALARSSRYRPLVLTERRDVARLGIAATGMRASTTVLPRLLAHLDTTGVITEWLDSGQDLRWEVLGDRAALEPVAAAAKEVELASRTWQEGMTCLSLAGGRPDSWLEVQRQVTGVLADLGVDGFSLRADGSALRILVPAAAPPELARRLHDRLLGS